MKANTSEPYTLTRYFCIKRLILCMAIYCGTMEIVFPQDKERMVMIHQETICRAPWIIHQNDTATSSNLKQLFKKDSVHLYKIEYTGKVRQVTCEACMCLTGRNIEITIRRQDQQKAEALGFKRPWIWMVKAEKVCDWTMRLNDEQIRQKLLAKKIQTSLVHSTGKSEKTNTDCKTNSGRKLTIKIDREDMKRATNEGFKIDDSINEF